MAQTFVRAQEVVSQTVGDEVVILERFSLRRNLRIPKSVAI